MKLFPNLAGSLRFYFGLARVLVLAFSTAWIFFLLCFPLLEGMFGKDPKLMVSFGEIAIPSSPLPLQLHADSAKPDSVALASLRGSFNADLFSKDPALGSAVRWSMIPTVLVNLTFSWLLLTALRQLCANIERRDVISEGNLRLVKKSGLLLIAFTISSLFMELWASHLMSNYLSHHVTLSSSAVGTAPLGFTLPTGYISSGAAVVIGGMLLLLAEAFRQGLALKAENDLTV